MTLSILSLLSFFLIISCGVVTALENPAISVDPQIITLIGAGEEFTVNITIDPGGYEVYGFQYTLYYNSSVLEVISQDQGAFLTGDGTSTYVVNKINESGKIEYAETRLNVQDGVTGVGLGTSIRFKCKVGDETTDLHLNDVIKITYVDGVSLESLIPDAVDGTVIIGESSDDGNDTDVELSIIRALNYLKGQQTDNGNIGDTEWVIMAIAAAGEDPRAWIKQSSGNSIFDYLKDKDDELELATDIEKYILAIVSSGENPYTFNDHDYVSDLKDEFDGTQVGDFDLLNDDFWAVIALVSAGMTTDDDIVQKLITHIKLNQQADGSWGCFANTDGDTDDTAAAIMALIAAGEYPDSNVIKDGFDFIKSNQNSDGGFGSGSFGSESNAGSVAWVLNAIYAVGDDPTLPYWAVGDNNPIDFLLTLQRDDGGFDWKPGVAGIGFTEEAVMSLSGKYYPARIFEGDTDTDNDPDQHNIYLRVEGQDRTIYAGNISFDLPFTYLDDWSGNEIVWDIPSVSVVIETLDDLYDLNDDNSNDDEIYTKDKWGGYFIQMIADEWSSGAMGWMYRVNYYSPEIGADAFVLDDTTPPDTPHIEILWYYGAWGEFPIRISVNDTMVNVSESVRVNTEYFDDDEAKWFPLANATVQADITYMTDENGTVEILMNHPGTYSVFAEKQNYIRSEKIAVVVEGNQDSVQVILSAEVVPAISFSVTPAEMDFGRIGAGYNKTGIGLNITNTGSRDICVTTEVYNNSSQLFKDSLYLGDVIWNEFNAIILHNASEWEYTMGPYITQLRVPMNYTGVGPQNGTLIFWAEAP